MKRLQSRRLGLTVLCWFGWVDGFVLRPRPLSSFRTSVSLKLSSETVNIVVASGCDTEAISDAAAFLVDSFWLGSPRQRVDEADGPRISDSVRALLIEEQAEDLMEKYGERLGKRLLNSCFVLAGTGNGDVLGLLCMQVLLLDTTKGDILTAEESEDILRNAVASLGPNERRRYKGSSAQQIAQDLLPPSQEAICCFSNLAVSPDARRQGIAYQLCAEVEQVARDWNFESVYLKVESDNAAAVKLYESKLGYTRELTVDADVAIRLDTAAGKFIETKVNTLVLKKSL